MRRIKPISRTASGHPGGCATALFVAFLGLFVVAGCAIGFFLSARPLYYAFQARAWTPTACEVISSQIVHGDETMRADIVYRYTVGDRQYTADRYNFLPGSNSDSTVPDVVERHPPGRRFECYVDPGDPARAVINRTPTMWYYFGLLFFVAFAGIPSAIGLAALYFRPRHRPAAPVLAGAQSRSVDEGRFAPAFAPAPGAGEAAPIVLEPTQSPLAKLLIITFICLFWNGIVAVFTYFEYQSFTEGHSIGWFLAAFLLLFQIIGVVLLGAVPYQLLALANPRPIITLSRGSIPLGGSVSFSWELSGAAHRVTALQMTLRGREEARSRRGTDTQTDTHVFFSEILIDASHAMSIPRGSGTIRIPGHLMHTFIADNNKVIWTLQVTGTIARWPDIDESFDITVRPT